MVHDPNSISDDLLKGVPKIARFLGWTERQVYHAVNNGNLPSFRVGASICSRRSTLVSHIERLERQSVDRLSTSQTEAAA